MILKINRFYESDKGTLGKFDLVNDQNEIVLSGSTIEREGPDTVTPNQNKRIPTGTYGTIIHTSPHFKTDLRLLFNDQVAKDRYILIHAGNSYKDLEGCIALGKSDNGKDFIYKSRDTINKFYDLVQDKTLKVIIKADYNKDDIND